MNWIEQALLILMSCVSVVALREILKRHKLSQPKELSNVFHAIAFLTLLLVGISLTLFGWKILGLMGNGMSNKMVAIIASLIPFAWATGLVSRFYPRLQYGYIALMLLGLFLISVSRFVELAQFSRIVYPVFHSTAGLTVIITPLIAVKKKLVNKNLLWVSLGGLLISMGGISLAFLSAGKQLLFFSETLVLTLMAPLLLVTSMTYAWGILKGENV